MLCSEHRAACVDRRPGLPALAGGLFLRRKKQHKIASGLTFQALSLSSRHVFGQLKPRPGLCGGRHGVGTQSPDGWFSFPAARWAPVPVLPLQRDSRPLASPRLSPNPGLIGVSDFRAGYREPCGVLPGSRWLTEAVTHVRGCGRLRPLQTLEASCPQPCQVLPRPRVVRSTRWFSGGWMTALCRPLTLGAHHTELLSLVSVY